MFAIFSVWVKCIKPSNSDKWNDIKLFITGWFVYRYFELRIHISMEKGTITCDRDL